MKKCKFCGGKYTKKADHANCKKNTLGIFVVDKTKISEKLS